MTLLNGEGSGQPEPVKLLGNEVTMEIEMSILKQRLASLQSSDPYNAVEMAIKIATEQEKVKDAFKARDAAIQRLSDAYISIEQKLEIIKRLEKQSNVLKSSEKSLQKHGPSLEADKLNHETAGFEGLVDDLRKEIEVLKDAPPQYTSDSATMESLQLNPPALSAMSLAAVCDMPQKTILEIEDTDLNLTIVRTSASREDAEDIINARNRLLAALPLPEEAPDDALKPIAIPTSYVNLYEFLASVPGAVSNLQTEAPKVQLQHFLSSLSNYRVLHQLTTSWCPQREEHGYYLTPVFKCTTNPRVATAHRWAATDVISKICKPTGALFLRSEDVQLNYCIECFYSRDGVFYYAGVYKAFRLDDLTVKEWEALSNETTQAIVKETIEGRKNTSPQNTYEVNQLYAAGALKVAVIALQCVGFNHSMYRLLLEHASKCTLSAVTAENRKTKLPLSSQATVKNSFDGSSELKNGSVNNIRSPGYSLGLGLGLGSGNIWNTNLGFGLPVGGAAGKAGEGSLNSNMQLKLNIKANSSDKATGGVGNENDKPPATDT
ncbi:hypothetical protein GGU10DRAFT_407786 [Lentinula aff. detonsa]|uniref:DUF6697 domain-containing protein n=1 Tax=Lentinula aff. detonsa TaxID=2804958 RepID=A0AA38KXV8_9AGAR|nr:hypothetical protein GGU10DRAFT_407786 [Lentinula aff. detonsa]